MSNMKRWMRERGITTLQLASQLGLSRASIVQKTNGNTEWQRRDCVRLRDLYGLSADFVQDLVPYETEFPQPKHKGVLV